MVLRGVVVLVVTCVTHRLPVGLSRQHWSCAVLWLSGWRMCGSSSGRPWGSPGVSAVLVHSTCAFQHTALARYTMPCRSLPCATATWLWLQVWPHTLNTRPMHAHASWPAGRGHQWPAGGGGAGPPRLGPRAAIRVPRAEAALPHAQAARGSRGHGGAARSALKFHVSPRASH